MSIASCSAVPHKSFHTSIAVFITGSSAAAECSVFSVDDITNNGNGDGNSDSNANKDNQSSSSTGGKPNDKANDANAEHGLEEGTIIEDGDNKYTVDKDGNLIDDNR